MALGKRISEKLAELGKSQTWLAERSGVDEGTISALITRDSKRSQFAPALAAALGVALFWLLTWQNEVGARPYRARDVDPHESFGTNGDELVAIPYVSATLSAGPGIENGSEDLLEMHQYSRAWIERHGFQVYALRRAKVEGESMRPTLFDGDVALINTADRRINNGRVFAFIVDGEVRVKRLYKTLDGKVRVVSDNPDKTQYPDEFLTPDQLPEIIGRVVDRSGKADL